MDRIMAFAFTFVFYVVPAVAVVQAKQGVAVPARGLTLRV